MVAAPMCTALAWWVRSKGLSSLVSALVSIIGIMFVGLAGTSKEGELSDEDKKKAVAEFNFKKGTSLAVISGLTSSAMSFGLHGGPQIQELAHTLQPPTSPTWAGMPVLVVVLLGGFAVNAIWCVFLNLRNRTIGDYMKRSAPKLPNLLYAAIAGLLWCSEFICFKIGEPMMGSTSLIG